MPKTKSQPRSMSSKSDNAQNKVAKTPPGRKRSSFPQRDKEIIKIAEFYQQGFSQFEIAAKMGLSQAQISRDLAEFSRRIAPEKEKDKEKLRDNWMEQNRLMKKKLWTAYDKSTEDKEVQTKKQIAGGDGEVTKER